MVREAARLNRDGRPALYAGILLGLGCVPLAADVAHGPSFLTRPASDLREIVAWAAIGGLAAVAFRFAPRRAAIAATLVLGLALRIASLATAPPLSDDLYRYGWDGRIQAAGIDPYRYAPDDPALSGFRDKAWLWPVPGSVHGCHVIAAAKKPDRTCTLINRSGVHTIYPPAAELWFTALHGIGADRLHAIGFELAGLLVDLALMAVMLSLLRSTGKDERLVAVWALSPLPVLEYVSDGHVDSLGLLLTFGAVALARRGRTTGAGAVIAVAALVKLYPALILVAILPRRIRAAAEQIGAFAAVFLLGYLPHVVAVGGKVLGYLPGYLKEEDYTKGTRYLVLADAGLHGKEATAAVVVVLAVACLLVLWRRPDPLIGATVLYGTLLLLTTPVQPWYAVALGGVALACGRWEWLAVGLAGYPLYLWTLTKAHDAVTVGRIAYGVALAIVLVGAVLRLRRPAAFR